MVLRFWVLHVTMLTPLCPPDADQCQQYHQLVTVSVQNIFLAVKLTVLRCWMPHVCMLTPLCSSIVIFVGRYRGVSGASPILVIMFA